MADEEERAASGGEKDPASPGDGTDELQGTATRGCTSTYY